MSFMFNPYPYDDPNAINHVSLSHDMREAVTGDTASTARRVLRDAQKIMAEKGRSILGIDGYVSAPMDRFRGMVELLGVAEGVTVRCVSTAGLYLPEKTLHDKLLPYLPEDRETDPPLLYGRLYNDGLEGLMDWGKIAETAASIEEFARSGEGLLILWGNGALIDALLPLCDLKLFIDMTQKRTILNIKNGSAGNLGYTERRSPTEMIRHCYYVDFEALMPHRGRLAREEKIDYYLTGDDPDKIQSLSVPALKELFDTMVQQPLRCKPVYIEGIWGGFYVKRLRNLPEEMKNCAWVFDLIPMEVSIVAEDDGLQLEFPFYFFVQLIGEKLMGKKAHEKFGGYFPIRFNYDDTYHASGNMSIQCHPDGDYVRKNNGELGRQDESYYMVVAGQEAKTYCGFRKDADVEEFIEKARRAEKYGEGFDHDQYVYSEPSRPGMQFLIPAGTIHASGRNQVILEIGSLTIGSYTYKMYDYMRKDLDGNLRPIHTYHGDKVLRRDFREPWVKENLIQQPRTLREGDGFVETVVGEHDLLYFSLHNVRFPERYTDETTDRFHVLVLVEGEKCLIRSLTNPEKSFSQNYLDMVIIPARFGPYEVINQGVGVVTMHKTLLKDGFENE